MLDGQKPKVIVYVSPESSSVPSLDDTPLLFRRRKARTSPGACARLAQAAWPTTMERFDAVGQVGSHTCGANSTQTFSGRSVAERRLNGVVVEAYLAQVFERIAEYPANRVGELRPRDVVDTLHTVSS